MSGTKRFSATSAQNTSFRTSFLTPHQLYQFIFSCQLSITYLFNPRHTCIAKVLGLCLSIGLSTTILAVQATR